MVAEEAIMYAKVNNCVQGIVIKLLKNDGKNDLDNGKKKQEKLIS